MNAIYAIDIDPQAGSMLTHYTVPTAGPQAPHTERLLADDYSHENVTEPCMVEKVTVEELLVPVLDEQGKPTEELRTEYKRTVDIVPGVRVLSYGVVAVAERRADEIRAANPDRLTERKSVLIALLAERRWQLEVGGFDFMGRRIMSDRESQAKIGDLGLTAQMAPGEFPIDWKCAGGLWLTLDVHAAQGLFTAGFVHVGGLFKRESALSAQINAATSQAELDQLAEHVEQFS